ncbi:Uncharacterised protein [Raoultella planticola]|uniref:Integrase catalytic domain-containing protein n=1 Tax=Raoultella planticola TaxID=575 RepID=A0A485ARR4_RAOPL|nr:Uncharacterised protein [Raoultella planticola]
MVLNLQVKCWTDGCTKEASESTSHARNTDDNATVESFNGRLRQECLNENWFMSLEDARCKIEAWRIHYNQRRPHSALGWMTPSEFC